MNHLSLFKSLFIRFSFLLFLLYFPISGYAQIPGENPDKNVDQDLTEQLGKMVNNFQGEVGIYVRHLSTGRLATIHAKELYPTASMIKVPILVTLFHKIAEGELGYLEKHIYADSMLYEGEDILGSFKSGEEITLSKLVLLMITMSDNTASLWCQKLAGTGVEINRFLAENGFEKTRMNSRTPDTLMTVDPGP